ncbi:serine/threonine protein kinase [Enhygromyxa salina]|uniref:Serine/threonine protein kinase n=1 Tax=Enhygromyxa salina TaxID=215803 RepID=A0A0C2D5J4_9BACT|nr:serine/threonine protein kinase [Enhygromyxa salina]
MQVQELPAVLQMSGDYQLSTKVFEPNAEASPERACGDPQQPLPASGEAQIEIAAPVTVCLHGAAYEGALQLSPSDCGADAVHVIHATPKPAKLSFQAGALPLSELSISCVAGCPYQSRTVETFPELPFPRGEHELIVELEFRARGHRRAVEEFKLSPGDNLLRVSLQRFL